MEPFFGPGADARIEALARGSTLLAFDYDGTLMPTVVDISRKVVAASTRALLGQLSERYPCAVISGRGYEDLRDRLADLGRFDFVGSHGLDTRPQPAQAADWARRVAHWRRLIDPALAGFEGVFIEDKRLSLSLHYRGGKDRRAAASAVHAIARKAVGARRVHGKFVVNLVPEEAPDKGDAVLALMRARGCEAALFVGDDLTDEDAFAKTSEAKLIGIRIGRWVGSKARFYLRRQEQIDALLSALAEARADGEPMREASGRRR